MQKREEAAIEKEEARKKGGGGGLRGGYERAEIRGGLSAASES